jgi:hypothetical protein
MLKVSTREELMASGLILLFFLAFLAALFLTRARRRMGFGVTSRTWAAIIAGFAIVVLAMWAASAH